MINSIKAYLGVIIMLIGVFILIAPALLGKTISSNNILVVSLIVLILGLLVQIILGKRS